MPDIHVTITEQFNEANDAVRKGVQNGLAEIAFALQDRIQENIGSHGNHPDGRKYLILSGAGKRAVYVECAGAKEGRDEAIAAAKALAAQGGEEVEAAASGTEIDLEYQAKAGVAMDHMIHHEYGTIDIPARPFVAPAAAEIEPLTEKVVGQHVADAIGGAL